MERIKVALEKARQEREGASSEQPARPATDRSAAAPSAATTDITYTQTLTAKVSPLLLKRNRIISAQSERDYNDAYKMLRTQVLQRLKENHWNVLAVTSPGEDEGKTLTAINLAASLALEISHTVLLVDANLRHPSIHERLGLPPADGLSEYLLDNADLQDLLIHPEGLDHVVLLTAGRSLQNSAEMLNSPRMAELVSELKNRYPERIVIFDLPPILSAADAIAFAPLVDAALLVLEEGRTRQEDAKRALELLDCTNVIGTVLNKVGQDD